MVVLGPGGLGPVDEGAHDGGGRGLGGEARPSEICRRVRRQECTA